MALFCYPAFSRNAGMPGPKKNPESYRSREDMKPFTAFMSESHKNRVEHVVLMGKQTQKGPQTQSELLSDALEKYLPSMERFLKARMKEIYG